MLGALKIQKAIERNVRTEMGWRKKRQCKWQKIEFYRACYNQFKREKRR